VNLRRGRRFGVSEAIVDIGFRKMSTKSDQAQTAE
jgi:hypothetical protein